MCDVYLGLLGKRVVVDFLSDYELFSLDVMAEVLRAKIDRKSAISLQCGQFDPKFQVEGTSPKICLKCSPARPKMWPGRTHHIT